jgi:hypothetical protein
MRVAVGHAAIAILAVALAACGSTPVPSGEITPTPSPDLLQPPVATLAAGGSSHQGEVGSYTLPTGGSDGPWLPAAALDTTVEVGARDALEVSLGDAAIGPWTAVYAPAGDRDPTPSALAASDLPAGSSSIQLPAPPTGDWVVMVALQYETGGSGAYYWHVRVTP